MDCQNIIKELKGQSNARNVAGMARFGIKSKNVLGISIPVLRKMAKKIGKNHSLAGKLWDSDIHEARILASYIDEQKMVTEKQMEKWVNDFDSWGICDQVCGNLFDKTPFVYAKAFEWSKNKKEYVKRAGFVLMACLAVHDKKADDAKLMKFFPVIVKGATDDRNFVKKAVNWALRQLGKRNPSLNKEAIKTAKKILAIPSKNAAWIAADAIREFKLKADK